MLQKGSSVFRKVMLKLTTLNSAVLLMVFVIYSITIYVYINNKLFDNIDSSMADAITDFSDYNEVLFPQLKMQLRSDKFRSPDLEEQILKSTALVGLRILVVAEDLDGQILIPEPNEKIDIRYIKKLLANTSDSGPQNKIINEHNYRILSTSYPVDSYPTVRIGKEKIITAKKIIAITVVDAEISILNRLLVIIMVGTASGFFLIIWAAYYLARRALVPIKDSWDKQQQFVADASHELRTPIAVIKTNTELLLNYPDHSIEEESVRIAGILNEATRMGKLVATLLTLARADSNQVEMDFSQVLLPDLLHEIIEQLQPIAEMKGIYIYNEFYSEVAVKGDRERLYQLFVILLDNAIKYTPAEGRIKVTGHIHQGSIHILLHNTGIGISKADIPFIFERFYRGDKVRSGDDRGSGLGLAIAKWIIEKHGGKIRVDSIKGDGTQFHLQLPLGKNVKK